MKHAQAADYRPDIDGLRALAVLAVIIFHLRAEWLPGGFAGVDIFFVISGYLITRHILQELRAGAFSLAEFYRRRIKRIAPAMLVVVGATLALSTVLMLPEDVRTTAKSAVWSLASLANFFFCFEKDSGYFAGGNENYPLLHLWSLGVEEQFYLLWPLLLMAWRPRSKQAYLLVAGVLAAASFLGAEWLAGEQKDLAYFMLPTRGGELLVGAMLAWPGSGADSAWRPRLAAAAALLGAGLIAWSLLHLSKTAHFPGLLALPPTIGAALLIQAGRSRYAGIGLFEHRLPVAIGKVSYSAYLWHWPLIALWQYGYGEPGLLASALLVALTFALAALSYRWVEVPARRSGARFLPLAWRQFVLPGGALGLVALALVYGTRIWPGMLETTYRKELARLYEFYEPALLQPYVCHRQRLSETDIANAQCVLGDGAQPVRGLLWGDSNAAHYIGVLGEFAKHGDLSFRNMVVGSCPPLLRDPEGFVEARRLKDCRSSLQLVWRELAHYDVVILGGSWPNYQARSPQFLDALKATVTELTGQGKRVILLGKVPEVPGVRRGCPMKALTYPALDCRPSGAAIKPEIAAVNDYLRELARQDSKVSYFDANDYLCANGFCQASEPDGSLRYVDTSHLTMLYSWRLGRRIYDAEGVPAIFRHN
ncbi:acyltransferase family protein [Pseudoduganella sp. OTU4001]|uniref:acyltransferase family protein n=1 Tax=Pseudoduganella sp. OTU4001 TaxID=3043854 RepID=UPI00313C74E4